MYATTFRKEKAARKCESSFDDCLGLILKKCKICTHNSDIIDTEVTHFNNVIQVETIKSTDENIGHILMTYLFSGFTLGATPPSMDSCTVIDTFFSHRVTGGNDPISAYALQSSSKLGRN